MTYCRVSVNSYHEKSRWLAAVRDAVDEIYRRDFAPYEDIKAELNGDLPWPSEGAASEQE